MHRSKKKRNLIIFSLVGILICMVVGYAAFSTQLEIKGTSKVTSNWDIRITNVTDGVATGTAENTVAPSWTNLTANMETDLYGKGDAMEYDVTIENKGTIDAKLDDITTNIQNANSDAVNITFSGYTKGEKLLKGESKIIHVKIEYNPNYTGSETSSEVKIDFNYTQNNNSSDAPDTYLLTYDYQTNGGTKVDSTGEYLVSGAEVNLQNTATKEGYTFIGWNTDKDAEIALQNYQMPSANTTLYAIYSKDVKITYQKGEGIESIGKETDTCTLYNNDASCEITLPSITASSGYEVDGWYNNDTKVGIANDKYQIKEDTTLIAKTLEPEPIIQSWSYNTTTDFHSDTYKNNIVTATFLDNKDVPENAVASWDVSDKKNKSVMAWVVANADDNTKYDLYIGGKGGVIANTNSSYLFRSFSALTSINFGNNFDTSNVTNMNSMFSYCKNLINLDLNNFDTSKVTNMGSMFVSCNALTTLNISSFDTSNVTDMSIMFSGCKNLTHLDVINFNTSKVTNMQHMFSSCSSLTSLDVSNFDTSKVADMSYMFSACSALTNLNLSNLDTRNVTNMSYMFNMCTSLTNINVSDFDTSKVTKMDGMFNSCSSLTSLDVSNFDTSNVTNMRYMFSECSKLINLDLSNFNTSNVINMESMFYKCSSLTGLDISNFDTGQVTNMSIMFYECSSLTSLDVSNFDTSNVVNMSAMFHSCSSLTTLDVSNFDTSNVTTMSSMFYECSSLTKLKLCSFDTSKVTDMSHMFQTIPKLTIIYVGPLWTMDNVTSSTNMFTGSGVSSVTLSNNCEVDAEDISLDVSTTKATNGITVVASAQADSGITKYEYSKDGGTTYETGTSNTYTFTGLNAGTNYDIKVRVTSKIGKTLEKQITITTNTLEKPTFTETKEGEVVINYAQCSSGITCSYVKDNDVETNVTSNPTVYFGSDGTLVATVSDGTNTASATYATIRTNMYVSSSGDDTNGYGTKEHPYISLKKAYDSATDTKQASIYVMSDLDILSSVKFNDANKDVILTSDSTNNEIYTLAKTVAYGDSIISVDAGKATFQNIIFDGKEIEDTNCGVYAYVDTELTLNEGVEIKNFINTDIAGGAGVRSRGSTIIINGAKIMYNKANFDVGLKLEDGTLNFIDGEVSNNTALTGSASGILLYNSTFNMSGGKISNNKTPVHGGGLYIGYYEDGGASHAKITGGEITNNSAEENGGGIFVKSTETQASTLEISGNVIISGNKGSWGGGICSDHGSTITMKGGTITNNTTVESGAGVYAWGIFNMSGGTINHNNAGTHGGGLQCKTNCTMTGGTISNNTVTAYSGGGVNVDGVFTLDGGKIQNNTATSNGGIAVNATGSYTYKSGTVCGNNPTNSYETSESC